MEHYNNQYHIDLDDFPELEIHSVVPNDYPEGLFASSSPSIVAEESGDEDLDDLDLDQDTDEDDNDEDDDDDDDDDDESEDLGEDEDGNLSESIGTWDEDQSATDISSPHSPQSSQSESDNDQPFSPNAYLERTSSQLAALVSQQFDLMRREIVESHMEHNELLDQRARRWNAEARAFGLGGAPSGLGREERENHRHHPYRLPVSLTRERSRFDERLPERARPEGAPGPFRNNFDLRSPAIAVDELVEMEVTGAGPANRRGTQPLDGRRPQAAGREGTGARPVRVSFIDLTEEPDGSDDIPILPHGGRVYRPHQQPNRASIPPPQQQQQHHRNPRRQMSLNNRTPSLTRSDGSVLGNQGGADYIDLTMDDESPPQPPLPRPPLPRRAPTLPPRPANAPPPLPEHIDLDGHDEQGLGSFLGIVRQFAHAQHHMNGLGFLHRIGGGFFRNPHAHEVEVQVVGHNQRQPHMNPLAANLPNFNYRANGYNNISNPKPAHVPPPPAREGYSRATGEDLDYVCPSCDEELKYDPDDEEAPPLKRPRNRKDREEHHFWALKECGHVYCKKCFENRKPTAKNTVQTGFRSSPLHPKKLLCAVPDCQTDVSAKPSWVGLFI